MLIDVPYKENDAITIKTTAGEELVARFVDEDADTVTITKPMALMASQQGVGLGPFTFTVKPDAKLKLNKSGILFVTKSDEEAAKGYLESTTGIAV